MKTEPYTIQRARIEYEQYGVVSVPDADKHYVRIYDDDEAGFVAGAGAFIRDVPIIVIPYTGEFHANH